MNRRFGVFRGYMPAGNGRKGLSIAAHALQAADHLELQPATYECYLWINEIKSFLFNIVFRHKEFTTA